METNIVVDTSPPIPYLLLELWAKMLSGSQIARLIKM